MARNGAEPRIVPSILDRLQDDRPNRTPRLRAEDCDHCDHKMNVHVPNPDGSMRCSADGCSCYEPPAKRFYGIREMKDSVARDLEEMLNTRREMTEDPAPEFAGVGTSIMVYGLPDFTSFNPLDPADCGLIRRSVEFAIARFEPRLERVRVSMEPISQTERSLRFKIEAILRIEPEREPVTFDTVLQLQTQEYSVRG